MNCIVLYQEESSGYMFGGTSRNIRYADLLASTSNSPKIFGTGSLVVPVQFAKTAPADTRVKSNPTLVISSTMPTSKGEVNPHAMDYIAHYEEAVAAQKKELIGGVDGSLYVFLDTGRTLPDWWINCGGSAERSGGTKDDKGNPIKGSSDGNATVILDLNKCVRHGDCSTTKCKKHPSSEKCPNECLKKGDAQTLLSHQYYFSSYYVGQNKHYSFHLEHAMTSFGDLPSDNGAGPQKTDNAIVLSISIYVKSLGKKFGTQVLAFAISLPPIIQFD